MSVAGKMVIIIRHLPVYRETGKDTQYRTCKPAKKVYVKVPKKTSIEEVLMLLSEAAIVIQEPDPEKG